MQEEEGIDVESDDAAAYHQWHCDGLKVAFSEDVDSRKLDEKADEKSYRLESYDVRPCASDAYLCLIDIEKRLGLS